MTDFKRTCRLFDKFLGDLKRREMGHRVRVDSEYIHLSFFFIGTNYEEEGYLVLENVDQGLREGFYEIYKTAVKLLKDHENSYKYGAFVRVKESFT